MNKLKLVTSFNDEEENYFKIKIEDISNEKYIKQLIGFLEDLKISNHLTSEPDILSTKYEKWIGRHEFFRTKDYVIHIIFSRDNLHLLVNCDLENREMFMKFLKKHCSFKAT